MHIRTGRRGHHHRRQARVVASEVKSDFQWSYNDDQIQIDGPEDVAAVRSTLDQYERWLDALKWGEATTDMTVTLPRSLLEKVARDLYNTAGDHLFHGSHKDSMTAIRAEANRALIANAIVDQLEAAR